MTAMLNRRIDALYLGEYVRQDTDEFTAVLGFLSSLNDQDLETLKERFVDRYAGLSPSSHALFAQSFDTNMTRLGRPINDDGDVRRLVMQDPRSFVMLCNTVLTSLQVDNTLKQVLLKATSLIL